MANVLQLPLAIIDGAVRVDWLTASDHAWIRVLLEEVAGLAGERMAAVEQELDERIRRRLGSVSRPRALGVARDLILRRCGRAIDAPAPPSSLRREVFGRVAREGRGRRDEVLAAIAEALSTTPAAVVDGLFADGPEARRLVLPEAPFGEQDVAEHTNLTIAQRVIATSEEVIVRCAGNTRSVYRLAKLRRLICAAHDDPAGGRVHVSGPLALFHRTTKYGAALASFIPALVSTPGWQLDATCAIGGQRVTFRADASAPIARAHALPRAHDSDVERRLDRDLRRLARGWMLSREADVVQIGDRLFFPDFTLVRGADRVLVEVVGFYTPDYLAKKLEALRHVARPLIVLVDQDLACADAEVHGDVVLRYRGRPDAAAVVAAAEALVGRRAPGRLAGARG